MICRAELQPDAPPNPTITDEDRAQRNPIYEQLGDPRVAVVGKFTFLTTSGHVDLNLAGRVGHQKRIRKLIRMLSFSAGIHIVVWEECYWRWRTLNESINNLGSQGTSGENADNGISQHVCFLCVVLQCNGLTSKNHRTPVFNGPI